MKFQSERTLFQWSPSSRATPPTAATQTLPSPVCTIERTLEIGRPSRSEEFFSRPSFRTLTPPLRYPIHNPSGAASSVMMPVAGKSPVSGLYASNVMPSKRYSPSDVPTHKKPSSVCASELTTPLNPSLAVQAEWYICAIGPESSAPNTGIAGVRSAAAHAIHRTVRSNHALPLMVASPPRCPYLRTKILSNPADPAPDDGSASHSSPAVFTPCAGKYPSGW